MVILLCKDPGDPGSLHLPASLSLEKSPGPHAPRWCLELQPPPLHSRQQDGRTKRQTSGHQNTSYKMFSVQRYEEAEILPSVKANM